MEKGSFGIKRTDKDFSRNPIDLTIDQTINADTENKLTSVLHFTNSISARQRWCKSRIRSTVISNIIQEAGLRKSQDITADLEKSKIEQSSAQLQAFFIEGIHRNINPIDRNIDKQLLFNISNGQAAPSNIADFLLNVEKTGNILRHNFTSECADDINRFEKPIKRN